MAKAQRKLTKISMSQVQTFKIANRRGYASVCKNNLTEGATVTQALERMDKALKRQGFTIS
jgi:hypothetical protein